MHLFAIHWQWWSIRPGSVSMRMGGASVGGRTHLQYTSPANRTVMSPFGLSGPTPLAPLLGTVEIISYGCHKGFGEAGFFIVILWRRDRSGIAGKAHNE